MIIVTQTPQEETRDRAGNTGDKTGPGTAPDDPVDPVAPPDPVDPVDPVAIIKQYYAPGTSLYDLLLRHGRQVAAKSLRLADKIGDPSLDRDFLEAAALLHDIGIIRVRAPALGCAGQADYICHGVFGREMLTSLGLPRHGLVCERHVGVGLTVADIRKNNFPLPLRDMRPISREETIITYADKFFSKHPARLERELSVEEVAAHLSNYGRPAAETFLMWARLFGEA